MFDIISVSKTFKKKIKLVDDVLKEKPVLIQIKKEEKWYILKIGPCVYWPRPNDEIKCHAKQLTLYTQQQE